MNRTGKSKPHLTHYSNVMPNLRATERAAGETVESAQPRAKQFDAYVAGAKPGKLDRAHPSALTRPRLPAGVVTAAAPTSDHYFPLSSADSLKENARR